ncbi:hypothetical protein [Brevibacillus choshinensis]|uniref:hypothetical protein n=1 Tax=Brevibacillus choshinensis TaxID=54911 RepID=UPI001379A32F|nr:hypothetical protein [Brevibacillus choshinensis]
MSQSPPDAAAVSVATALLQFMTGVDKRSVRESNTLFIKLQLGNARPFGVK